MQYKHIDQQPENPYSQLVNSQKIAIVPEFEVESGAVLENVPVAYKTWGTLNETGDNCILICHALTGSADVSDWWGPLLGPGKAFDPTKFFIVCLNALGSPYGSASPVTLNPKTNERYGPEFPLCTVRDDVNIHRLILEDLNVKQVAMVIGGSMGGMLTLEWAFTGDFVKNIVALATSARNSAWCISWSEAQRQCIYSDPKYNDGYYDINDQPKAGLAAARMTALLTYRSRNSFEQRFGRKDTPSSIKKNTGAPVRTPTNLQEENWAIHNEGHNSSTRLTRERSNSSDSQSSSSSSSFLPRKHQTSFSAQSYLRYQGEKFVQRFDANCYISISRKLDTHDVARGRTDSIESALATLKQNALIVGVDSDALFTFSEQETIAKYMPNAKLEKVISPDGHDAFLLEIALINKLVLEFINTHMKDLVDREGVEWQAEKKDKKSVFAEEDDVTNW